MMKPKTFYYNFCSILLCSLVILFFINDINYAGENPKKKTKHWKINFSLGSMYDDNILKYSEKYIERFKNYEDEGRFHISRYDDMVIQNSLGVSFTTKLFGKLKSIFSAEVDYNAYSYNSIKNWSQFSVGWRQYIVGSTSCMFSYSYIPNFYIRHFRDEDWVNVYGYTPITFQPYEFAKDNFNFWIQHYIIKGTRIKLSFSYMKYFHNEFNTEYDCDDFEYGIRIYQTITKYLDVNIGYAYTTSDAKGYDRLNETKELSDDSDATNYEHFYTAGFGLDLPKIFNLKNDISVAGQYFRRFYTTNHYLELDPIHAGRHDYNFRVYFRYNVDLLSSLSLSLFYNWIYRYSDTSAEENREYLSDEKDYTQNQMGFKINYEFEF